MTTFIAREESFICSHCGVSVAPLGQGTYRNHCPRCLYSKHVDDEGPGDRASSCQGLLKPIGIDQDGKKGFMIIHQCVSCKKECRNKAAPDDDLAGFLSGMTK